MRVTWAFSFRLLHSSISRRVILVLAAEIAFNTNDPTAGISPRRYAPNANTLSTLEALIQFAFRLVKQPKPFPPRSSLFCSA